MRFRKVTAFLIAVVIVLSSCSSQNTATLGTDPSEVYSSTEETAFSPVTSSEELSSIYNTEVLRETTAAQTLPPETPVEETTPEETTPEETNAPEPAFDLGEYQVPDVSDLYNVTELIPKDSLQEIFMRDDETLGIVSTENNKSVLVHYLDLNTGKLTKVYESGTLISSHKGKLNVDVISTNPVIIMLPAFQFLLYPEEGRRVILPKDHKYQVVCQDETIYLLEKDSGISVLNEEGIPEFIWAFPVGFDQYQLIVSPAKDDVRFTARRMIDGKKVCVRYYPGTDAYDVLEDYPEDMVLCKTGGRCLLSGDTSFIVADKELQQFYSDQDMLLSIGVSVKSAAVSHAAVSENCLCFISSKERVSNKQYYIWRFSEHPLEESYSLEMGTPSTLEQNEEYKHFLGMLQDLLDRFNVHVVYGTALEKEVGGYNTKQITDLYELNRFTSTLLNVMASYPDGFYDKLLSGEYNKLLIYYTGALERYSETGEYQDAAGCAWPDSSMDSYRIAFVVLSKHEDRINTITAYHELTHVTDFYLQSKGLLNDWEKYYFPGFEYDNNPNKQYTVDDDATLANPELLYFYTAYGKQNALEDRACLMQNLMDPIQYFPQMYKSSHIREKYEAYFSIIREGFQLDWGDVIWEKLYNQYTGQNKAY